jgi:hypothetical protein
MFAYITHLNPFFMKKYLIILAPVFILLFACKKNTDEPIVTPPVAARLIFKFKFDSLQARLDGFGNPSTIPSNHQAQSPVFNAMSAHYIELAQGPLTQLGKGAVLYKADETSAGGSKAIDFSKSKVVGEGGEIYSVALNTMAAGTYQYLRISLAYQNYDIRFKSGNYHGKGTLASFIGYNSYITQYKIKDSLDVVNANKLQGYWAFEYNVQGFGGTVKGQAPGAITVPNPLSGTSPIPAGSCVVTGAFVNASGLNSPLVITGNETKDIVVTVSVSTNKSFEWEEKSGDSYYEPVAGDMVVDMGVRGMIPIVK